MRVALLGCFLIACSVPDKRAADPSGDDVEIDAGATIDTPPPEIDAPSDLVPPETKLDDSPAAFSNLREARFRFSASETGATFLCRVDEQAAEACVSPFARMLDDGPHTFSVRATDAAGNMDDTPAERVWTIDTVAPDTIVTDGPPSADNSVSPIFAFRSPERNVTFECSLDNAAFVACTSGASFGPLGDGPHAFSVRARDRAGNIDLSPDVYPWTVNTSTPDTQIVTDLPQASPSTSATFMLFSTAGAGATYTCALDGAAFATCPQTKTYSNLVEGSHTFAARVRDAIGNVDPSPATRAWTVDLTTPNTTISAGPSAVVATASASFMFAASEDNATFTCSLDSAAFVACSSPASYDTLAQGAHTFAVRATDAAGHIDLSPATRSWTVDTVSPDVAITAGPASTTGPRVSVSFTASEGAVTCSLDGGAFAACTSPLATNQAAGPHMIVVRAIDAAGNTGSATRSWTVACAAPDATGAAGQLHLDDFGQILSNAVPGGASATLGDTDTIESSDPTMLAPGRFIGAIAFASPSFQHAAWPVALPASSDFTVELWVRPESVSGTRTIVATEDGRIALRLVAVNTTTVRLSIAVAEGTGGATRTVSSAAIEAGAWHHVIASLAQPTLRLWVDGVRTEVATVALVTPLGFDAIRIGGTGVGAYDGVVDELWLAQTAITDDEAALARYCPL